MFPSVRRQTPTPTSAAAYFRAYSFKSPLDGSPMRTSPASGFFFLTCSVLAISCSDAAHKSAANPPARLGFTLRHSVHQLRIRNRLRVKIGNTFRLENVVKGRATKELYCGHPRLYRPNLPSRRFGGRPSLLFEREQRGGAPGAVCQLRERTNQRTTPTR